MRHITQESISNACAQLSRKGQKITTTAVIKITGGAHRKVKGFIEKWESSQSSRYHNVSVANPEVNHTDDEDAMIAQIIARYKAEIELMEKNLHIKKTKFAALEQFSAL